MVDLLSDPRHAIPDSIQHYDFVADDSDNDDGSMEALVHGTPSRYATACSNRSGLWLKCGHVPFPPQGTVTLLASKAPSETLGRLRSRTTTQILLEGVLVSEESCVYAIPLSRPTQCSLCESSSQTTGASTQWRWRDDAHWTFGTLPCCSFDRKRVSMTKMSCTPPS